MTKIFSVDAESDGLYGAIWAIGAVVMESPGVEVARFEGQLDSACVTDTWVQENIVPVVDLPLYASPKELRDAFWAFWMLHKKDAICLSDFGAPVEARLFRDCVLDDPQARTWEGPYPMHELGTLLLATGNDPDISREKLSGLLHVTRHNPADDALMAVACWYIATKSS